MGPENDQQRREMQRIPYSSAVGLILYTRLTRIDCLTAIAEVGRFMYNPGKQHWDAVKRIVATIFKSNGPMGPVLPRNNESRTTMDTDPVCGLQLCQRPR